MITDPFAVVPRVLDLVRLSGAIFFRSRFRSSWSYTSPPTLELAGALPPGSGSLVMFHIVVDGHCRVALEDGVRHELSPGEVVVMPYGNAHSRGSYDPAESVSIASLLPPRPWTELPAASRTVLVDGFVRLLGRPPIRYLTEWRLNLASGLLRTSESGVGEIAAAVGYASEQAFSRAFKRAFGRSPAHWRADRGL